MRVGAVLLAHALGALAQPEEAGAAHRTVEIADHMSSALGKMVKGVEHFLTEAADMEQERQAHAFLGQGTKQTQVSQEEYQAVDLKGRHLAQQVLKNLKALDEAAKALQAAAHSIHTTPPHVLTAAEQEGYTAKLEQQVAALRTSLKEGEEEKQQLTTAVANLMHRGEAQQLKQQLADAKQQIVSLQQGADQQLEQCQQRQQQVTDDNQVCTKALSDCQEDARAEQTGKVQQEQALTEVNCQKQLTEATQRAQAAEAEHTNMVQTVQMMVKESDDLKAQLKTALSKPQPAPAPAAMPTVDVAHMGDTVKIDKYIAQAGTVAPAPAGYTAQAGTAGPAPAKIPGTAPLLREDDVPAKPVHFQAASVRAASDALAGRGDIGKYLSGGHEDEAPKASGSLDEQIDALLPKDEEVAPLPAKKALAPRPAGSDDLAQKLLLQAEQTLKLAA